MPVQTVEGNLVAAFAVLRGKPAGVLDANLDGVRERMASLGFLPLDVAEYRKVAPHVESAAEMIEAATQPGMALLAFERPMTFNVIAGRTQDNERPVVEAIRSFSAMSNVVQSYDLGYRLHAPKLPKEEQAGLRMHLRGVGGAMYR